jgi:hypothetical protein
MRTVVWSTLLSLATAATAAAQGLTFTPLGSIPAPVDSVKVAGTHAYVAAGHTFTVYDVSNPSAPSRQGEYKFPEEIWAFRIYGSLAYVGANFFGLGILDLSNPKAPALKGSFKTPGQAKTAAVVGSKVAVIDHMEGLVFADASNPAKPVGAGTYFLDGYGRDVTSADRFAYAVDSPTGFYILDLSKPPPHEPIGVSQSGAGLRTVEVSGSLAILGGNGLLQPYDVSNPAAPSRLPPFKTPGGAQRVAIDGKMVYVADGREGLQVVDFSVPAKPTIVGTYKTAGSARDVAFAGGLVFVVVSEPGGRPQDGGQVVILRRQP